MIRGYGAESGEASWAEESVLLLQRPSHTALTTHFCIDRRLLHGRGLSSVVHSRYILASPILIPSPSAHRVPTHLRLLNSPNSIRAGLSGEGLYQVTIDASIQTQVPKATNMPGEVRLLNNNMLQWKEGR